MLGRDGTVLLSVSLARPGRLLIFEPGDGEGCLAELIDGALASSFLPSLISAADGVGVLEVTWVRAGETAIGALSASAGWRCIHDEEHHWKASRCKRYKTQSRNKAHTRRECWLRWRLRV